MKSLNDDNLDLSFKYNVNNQDLAKYFTNIGLNLELVKLNDNSSFLCTGESANMIAPATAACYAFKCPLHFGNPALLDPEADSVPGAAGCRPAPRPPAPPGALRRWTGRPA